MVDFEQIYDLYQSQGYDKEISFIEFMYMFKESQASIELDRDDTWSIDSTPPIV